jgi:fatty-acid desaturase
VTWMINSVTHMWGTRRYDTTDDSRNLWWVGLLAFGEGWHNNHHAHAQSARHGLVWWEVDLNWYGIKILQLLGLARDVKIVDVHGFTHSSSRNTSPVAPELQTNTLEPVVLNVTPSEPRS